MKQIPTLFEQRQLGKMLVVIPEVRPSCAWVANGDGAPTRKLRGHGCLIQGKHYFKRYIHVDGRPYPKDFLPIPGAENALLGTWPGWVPVTPSRIDDKPFRDGFELLISIAGKLSESFVIGDGTYELIGPAIKGNPEAAGQHMLLKHTGLVFPADTVPRDFDGLGAFFRQYPDIPGIVWWSDFADPNCAKAQLLRTDFGGNLLG